MRHAEPVRIPIRDAIESLEPGPWGEVGPNGASDILEVSLAPKESDRGKVRPGEAGQPEMLSLVCSVRAILKETDRLQLTGKACHQKAPRRGMGLRGFLTRLRAPEEECCSGVERGVMQPREGGLSLGYGRGAGGRVWVSMASGLPPGWLKVNHGPG